jgi:hypothetical protein
MPISWKQFENLGSDTLLARILQRQKYLSAYAISKNLDLDPVNVVREWGYAKVHPSLYSNQRLNIQKKLMMQLWMQLSRTYLNP